MATVLMIPVYAVLGIACLIALLVGLVFPPVGRALGRIIAAEPPRKHKEATPEAE